MAVPSRSSAAPCRCFTSTSLPPPSGWRSTADVPDRIRDSIDKVLSRQDSTGAFGLWSAQASDDTWLNAFVTDFLTRAREEGYPVPQKAFDQALERLRNAVANSADAKDSDTSSLAYAVYVLARNGRPVIGDLRYLVDTKLGGFDSPLAQAQLAAALAMLGDTDSRQQGLRCGHEAA